MIKKNNTIAKISFISSALLSFIICASALIWADFKLMDIVSTNMYLIVPMILILIVGTIAATVAVMVISFETYYKVTDILKKNQKQT